MIEVHYIGRTEHNSRRLETNAELGQGLFRKKEYRKLAIEKMSKAKQVKTCLFEKKNARSSFLPENMRCWGKSLQNAYIAMTHHPK